MIKVSVFYPKKDGTRFDENYYLNKHMPMVRERLSPLGLVEAPVDKGLAGGGEGDPPPFYFVANLVFNKLEDFQSGMQAHGEEIMSDIPNYTDTEPVIQVSEMLD